MTNIQKCALSAVVEEITPAIAEAYLQHNKNNRHANMAQVKYYAEQIKKGNWKLNGEPICFDENGNLTNGQHRLMACVMAGIPFYCLVVRNTEEGSAATYDQGKKRSAGDVFAICDILNSTRTAALVRRYHTLREGRSIANKTVGDVSRNGAFALSASEMVNLYNQYPEKFQEFGAYSQCLVDKWRIYKASEIGAIMMFLNVDKGHDELEIYRFFDMLFDYREHPEYGDGKGMVAANILRDRILRAASNGQKIRSDIKHALLRKVWNTYAEGKDLKTLKLTDNELDYFI